MGKSSQIIKSLILGAKAFSKDRSGLKKEQSVTNKIKNQWSVDKSYSCRYDPDDDSDDRQVSKSNEHIDHGIPEGGFASVLVESELQSETTVVKPIHEDSEVALSDTVVKPNNFEELAEEQGSAHRTNEEISIEENAAIVIQAAFRGFLGRRAFRAIKAALRFQDLVDGQIVKQQTNMDSRCMQALIKVQACVRARQVQMSEEGQAVQQQIQHKRQLQTYNAKFQEDWDHSLATLEELQAKLQNKQDAAIRREKALAYASLQQLRICGQRKNQQVVGDCIHSDQQPHLSWTWLERWMAARPSDNTELVKDIKKNNHHHYLDDNKQDRLTTPQCGKIKRNKKKTIDKQPIPFLPPTTPLPYNNPITVKTPSPTPAKSSMSRTPAKSSDSSGHESPKNNFGDPETGTNHHIAPRKLLFNGDDYNKDRVEAEESCGSNVICSIPEIKAKADSSGHDPKLRHNSYSENGPTQLGIPKYMSTTKSSKAKVQHWNDLTKPNPPSITTKSALGLVSPYKLDVL